MRRSSCPLRSPRLLVVLVDLPNLGNLACTSAHTPTDSSPALERRQLGSALCAQLDKQSSARTIFVGIDGNCQAGIDALRRNAAMTNPFGYWHRNVAFARSTEMAKSGAGAGCHLIVTQMFGAGTWPPDGRRPLVTALGAASDDHYPFCGVRVG